MNNTKFYLAEKDLKEFRYYLQERENSGATIEKYMRDVKKIMEFAGTEQPVDKEKLLKYKEWLIANYAVSSVNSMLVRTARQYGKEQIAMIMETMCATGNTVWSSCRKYSGKNSLYILGKNRIRSGVIFRTRIGREKNRSNIWKEMKVIGDLAGVSLRKVFPHNLRHLFARTFYRETKNLINLADILGHSNLDVTRGYASDGIKEWKRNMEKINLIETET